LALPEKIKKKEFTREEQVVLSGRLRETVILDAADEAIYKASRRASRNLTPGLDPPRQVSARPSSENRQSAHENSKMAEVMYESFRWMDEEEDLDLKLALDDYHANLDGFVIPTQNSTRRPSFRRTMSISKMPFGRNSMVSTSPKFEHSNTHTRRKSRTLSLIGPRHGAQSSISSIDPNATHYQDPEARLKLRVYLASPQKFDEAIEFGFPSMDGVADGVDKENKAPKRVSKDISSRRSHGNDRLQTSFLNDDATSLFDDDVSMVDPESPLTPMGPDFGLRAQRRPSPTPLKGTKTSEDFSHLGLSRPTVVKQSDSYAHSMAGSREMTLRMTLTRPDLRADESTLYGWQTAKSPRRDESWAAEEEMEDKIEVRGPFGGNDGWGPAERENGVVKRFWNKVMSGQRKTS
jgi:hypothetical protein